MTDSGSKPYFAFESDVRPVPATPTHCLECKAELEPLRRYAGRCRRCVARKAAQRAKETAAKVATVARLPVTPSRVLRTVERGGMRYCDVECGCGARRLVREADYTRGRQAVCNRCRLRQIKARGFDPEASG